jgi:hypothetical protein
MMVSSRPAGLHNKTLSQKTKTKKNTWKTPLVSVSYFSYLALFGVSIKKHDASAGLWWFTPVIPATQEGEIRRMTILS